MLQGEKREMTLEQLVDIIGYIQKALYGKTVEYGIVAREAAQAIIDEAKCNPALLAKKFLGLLANYSQAAAHQLVSENQICFLEKLIWRSKDAGEFTKKCLILLIRNSDGLSKEVRLILDKDVAQQVRSELHDMCSDSGSTFIDHLMHLAGAKLAVSYGRIALDKSSAGTPAEEIAALEPTRQEIEAIVPSDEQF